MKPPQNTLRRTNESILVTFKVQKFRGVEFRHLKQKRVLVTQERGLFATCGGVWRGNRNEMPPDSGTGLSLSDPVHAPGLAGYYAWRHRLEGRRARSY